MGLRIVIIMHSNVLEFIATNNRYLNLKLLLSYKFFPVNLQFDG